MREMQSWAVSSWSFIFLFHSFTQDVVARIKLPAANFMVQCHKELSGCGSGGWTPVMKIDGSKVWFTFSSWETLICTLIYIHLINTLLPNRLTFKYMFCNFKNKPHFSSLVNLRSLGIYRLGWVKDGGSHCSPGKRKGISRPLQSIREKGRGGVGELTSN